MKIYNFEDPSYSLSVHGEYVYDNIILISSQSKNFGSLTADNLLNFVESGGSVLLATESDMSVHLLEFALQCGIQFDTQGSFVVDHFSHLSDGSNM